MQFALKGQSISRLSYECSLSVLGSSKHVEPRQAQHTLRLRWCGFLVRAGTHLSGTVTRQDLLL